jgi:hypothetical protein
VKDRLARPTMGLNPFAGAVQAATANPKYFAARYS